MRYLSWLVMAILLGPLPACGKKKCGKRQWHDVITGERESCKKSSGSDDDVTPPPGGTVNPSTGSEIETALKSLGVDVAATPRKDAGGNDLPDTFSPLGARRDLTKFDELLIGGLNISGSSKRVNFLERKPATPAVDATE